MLLFSLLLACGPDPKVVATGLSSPNPAVRSDMLDLARKVVDPQVSAALVAGLSDPSPALRVKALEALAEQGDLSVVPQVAESLSDPEHSVQVAAAETLGQLADPAGAQPLIDWLSEQERPELNGIWALGEIGDPVAIPLLARLVDHRDPYVAYNAGQALREIGDAPAAQVSAPETPQEPTPTEQEAPETPEPAAPSDAPPLRKDRTPPPKSQKVAWPPG